MAEVYLSIGSNIDPAANIRAAITALKQHYHHVILSPIYETEAVGFVGDNFYNLVVQLNTDNPPDLIAKTLRDIEHQQGRKRTSERFNSRTLDIDLILYDEMVLKTDLLELPRGEILKYAFVLKPLADLSPDKLHPTTQQTYRQLWAAFDHASQPLWPVLLTVE
ncbi:2-amino-4-hydroxy-6-hydroxymethyldihydropteridine diphosphokinase [Thioflexithrix psekupsensis]|uniref:2-amino-4-hydroxy-6-hydroxymethyldihydropteridine diphosphokinase n=1 Tax=Thioflexithrix psekupsensis TaxID=1570016 RepID=A0A251X3A3_9GAMM|nr:2-amino-4-hydroxy-6-hydroxymethyldihydropteridine diphosphokinase [Thioflexithrix psekupsensis]OUD11723.1 2-amino-4-hydroxy-6-hydroxymethyldihydropteridine diphosphokinase [Thioflexithrix psekupsensis]